MTEPSLIALVVDDEAPARSELRYLLEQDERIGSVLVASSGTDALRVLESERVDVVFSDISMPGLDGMELGRVLARFATRPAVVFVTAHDQHAVDAFAIDASDYVMKPVRPERLAEAVRRVVASVQASVSEPKEEDETIPVELGGVTRFVARSEIRYVRAHGDFARLHTETGSHLVRIPLNTHEERWAAADFVRIHRSILVSLRHVTQVRMDHGRATVRVGEVDLQVSRRHMRDLRQRLLSRPSGP